MSVLPQPLLDSSRFHRSSMHSQPRAGYLACMQGLGSCTAGLTNKFGFDHHLCIPCRQSCNAFNATPCGLQGVLVPKRCITQCSFVFQHQVWQSAHVQSQVASKVLHVLWHGGCAFCVLGKLTPHNACNAHPNPSSCPSLYHDCTSQVSLSHVKLPPALLTRRAAGLSRLPVTVHSRDQRGQAKMLLLRTT